MDRERGELDPADEELLAVVRKNHESNPMLGLRGARLLLTMPGLIELQVRAHRRGRRRAPQGRR